MSMIDDNPKLGRRIATQLKMKREALAYLNEVMTDDPPPSDIRKHESLTREIARLEDLMS